VRNSFSWPEIAVEEAVVVSGGKPFAWIGDQAVGATATPGQGRVCLIGFGTRFSDAYMGGTADVVPDAELEHLHALGVRGVRVNVSPVKPPQPGFSATMLPRIERLEARCAELGWQLDFLTPGWLTRELMPVLRRLKVDFTVAHMGMFLAQDGPAQAGFRELIDLLRHGEGRCWVKLTGVYRMSTAPGFADAVPMARALIEAAPDRIIWGSDYPHLSFADKVGSVELFNLLADWAPDEATRHRILVDNPQHLFRF